MKTNTYMNFAKRIVMVFAIGLMAVNAWGVELIIDGDHSSLTSTATSAKNDYAYTGSDDNSYTISMKGVKYQGLGSGYSNNLSSGKTIFGAPGMYIYNSTALGCEITKFEVYSNKGASPSVSIAVCFGSSKITSLSETPDYSATL